MYNNSNKGGCSYEKQMVRVSADGRCDDVRLLDAKVIAEQQRIADVFHQLKLIPKPLSVKDIVWSGQ